MIETNKLQHIIILSELLLCGAKNNFVEITTSDIAKKINRSQQLASKEILDLELYDYIQRNKKSKKFSIKVTEKGYQEVYNLYLNLKTALDSFANTIDFEGEIVPGMGEGAYYISLEGYQKQFKEKLGYEPYPGTLNIKLNSKIYVDAKKELLNYSAILIDGFSDATRTYGWAKCYLSSINNNSDINAAVLVLERTHYDDTIMEIIAPFSIKEKFHLQNGSIIRIKVKISS